MGNRLYYGCPRAGRFACAVLAALWVTGCATLAPPSPTVGAGKTPDPAELTQWVARGRLALTAGDEGGSGSFVWQQRSERTELTVRGPLGAGGLRIVTDGSMLQVEDGAGQPLDGDAAREAIERRLGVRLPLEPFRYWMLGVPAPSAVAEPAVAGSVASGFSQAGWTVTHEAFQSVGPWSLPTRFSATTAETRVRVVVDDWQLVPGAP